ncbi:MAG: hypothetical protein IE922_01985 [Sphingomonadales bacterium]|nr:hypothetical protein [Sphingomonadales bacterium]
MSEGGAHLRPGWAGGDWVLAPHAERIEPRPGTLRRVIEGLAAAPMARIGRSQRRLRRFAAAVLAEGAAFEAMDEAALRAEAPRLAAALRRGGSARATEAATCRAFALVREVTGRRLGMRHYPVQIMAARVLLDGGMAELATGEGKTITGLLAAVTSALAGLPAHVITVNHYLAERDAAQLGPVIEFCGLTVGVITADMPPPAKTRAYRADVVFVTNKDLGFDYLRDTIALGPTRSRARTLIGGLARRGGGAAQTVMQGLPLAILDEADLVLADEARIPLVISAPRGAAEDGADFVRALDLGRALVEGRDFRIDRRARSAELTAAGRVRAAEISADWGGLWRARRGREERAEQALAALHLYHRGQQYVLLEGEIQIVDENTGRISPGRAWERGLHQMIETKEGATLSGRSETSARITYQRLFRRYLRLSGMTGTARGLETEMWRVYGLRLMRIPTHNPPRRRDAAPVLWVDAEARAQAVAARAAQLTAAGRAVLIGTRSVASSEDLAARLAARDQPAQVINALNDAAEAAIVAEAGGAGRLTIATNMAGRGTDIKPAPSVLAGGGLHVIVAEPNDSPRSDRQLIGRAGRQGDPGSSETFACPEDELFRAYLPGPARFVQRAMRGAGVTRLGGPLPRLMIALAQARAEGRAARLRAATLKSDRTLAGLLGFAGRSE